MQRLRVDGHLVAEVRKRRHPDQRPCTKWEHPARHLLPGLPRVQLGAGGSLLRAHRGGVLLWRGTQKQQRRDNCRQKPGRRRNNGCRTPAVPADERRAHLPVPRPRNAGGRHGKADEQTIVFRKPVVDDNGQHDQNKADANAGK
ncbi:hypothetical protein SDC9_211968 [bioreactor metagenome]|uniref:Uncharacterized protein n=1 Tax=bioreactor metagenome TaxID=1076179 RepID=A0A645JLG0_9ZZZZ